MTRLSQAMQRVVGRVFSQLGLFIKRVRSDAAIWRGTLVGRIQQWILHIKRLQDKQKRVRRDVDRQQNDVQLQMIHRRVFLTLVSLGILLAALGVGFLGYSYLLPELHHAFDQSNLHITVTSPAYLSVGDEHEILVTVANNGTMPMTNTVIVLAYESPLALSSALDQSSALAFGDLAGGELKSKSVKLRLQEGSGDWLDQARGLAPLKFSVRMKSGSNNPISVGDFEIQIARFAYLGQVFNFAFAGSWGSLSALWLWLVKQWWDDFSKPDGRANRRRPNIPRSRITMPQDKVA